MVVSFLISGCSTASIYKEILKEKPSYNMREFPISEDILYRATIRTIYSKNFIIEKEDEEKGLILAKRVFQRGRRTIDLMLQARITSIESDKSTLYLNAIQTTLRTCIIDRTRFFLWLIPLPGGGGKQATEIQEDSRTIEDRRFFENFFSLIEKEIKILEETIVLEGEASETEPGKTQDIESDQINEIELEDKGQLEEEKGDVF